MSRPGGAAWPAFSSDRLDGAMEHPYLDECTWRVHADVVLDEDAWGDFVAHVGGRTISIPGCPRLLAVLHLINAGDRPCEAIRRRGIPDDEVLAYRSALHSLVVGGVTYPEYVDDDFLRRDADDPIAQLATVEPAPRRTLTNPLGEASADG